MKLKYGLFAFVALLLVININCIRVIEDKTESTTNIENLEKLENVKESSESETTVKSSQSLIEPEPRIVDYHATTASSSTEANTQTIPPTLVNTKHDGNKDVTEKPEPTVKDIG
jgi:hypothetical protein